MPTFLPTMRKATACRCPITSRQNSAKGTGQTNGAATLEGRSSGVGNRSDCGTVGAERFARYSRRASPVLRLAGVDSVGVGPGQFPTDDRPSPERFAEVCIVLGHAHYSRLLPQPSLYAGLWISRRSQRQG